MIRRITIGLLFVALVTGTVLFLALPGGSIGHKVENLVGAAVGTAEEWAAAQLQRVIDDHLGVNVEFTSLSFESSDTVVLTGITFTDEGHIFAACSTLRITLAALPMPGEPVQISSIGLDGLVTRLIERPDGGLVGWPNLVRSGGGQDYDDGGSTRLSDVFRIDRFIVTRGLIEYQPGGGLQPMRFDGIEMDLDAESGEPGWYDIKTTIDRTDIAQIAIDGRLNLDTGLLELRESTIEVAVSVDQYELFPPLVQQFLREHEITGRLTSEQTGSIPLGDARMLSLNGTMQLQDGHGALGAAQLPLDDLNLDFAVAEQRITIPNAQARVMGGEVTLSGVIPFDAGSPSTFDYDASNLQIARAVRVTSGEQTQLAGLLGFSGSAEATMSDLLDTLEARGRAWVEQGHLVHIPLVSDLVDAAGGEFSETGSDSAEANFVVAGDQPRQLQLHDFNLTSGAIAARGDGVVGFDGQIDFRLNAGPLERVQSLLGVVGDVLGSITDQILKYRVKGTLSEPEVSVEPLGIGGD